MWHAHLEQVTQILENCWDGLAVSQLGQWHGWNRAPGTQSRDAQKMEGAQLRKPRSRPPGVCMSRKLRVEAVEQPLHTDTLMWHRDVPTGGLASTPYACCDPSFRFIWASKLEGRSWGKNEKKQWGRRCPPFRCCPWSPQVVQANYLISFFWLSICSFHLFDGSYLFF